MGAWRDAGTVSGQALQDGLISRSAPRPDWSVERKRAEPPAARVLADDDHSFPRDSARASAVRKHSRGTETSADGKRGTCTHIFFVNVIMLMNPNGLGFIN